MGKNKVKSLFKCYCKIDNVWVPNGELFKIITLYSITSVDLIHNLFFDLSG